MPLSEVDIELTGVRLRVATAGPEEADPILLLHGWPESKRAFFPIVPFLEDRYRLIMPDQRGFGASDRPTGTDAYRIATLLGDVAGLIEWTGRSRVHVVGHDLGGMVAWALGAVLPHLVRRMVVLAVPHPLRFKAVGAGNVEQLQRAFYVWLMHAGAAGERLLGVDDYRLLAAWAFGDRIPAEVQDAYRAEWAQPGAFHAMAEWYRANYTPDLLNPDVPLALPPVRVPVRYLHGERDLAFTRGLETGSGAFVDADYDEQVVPGTTHWMIHERPDEIARLVKDWVGA